MVSTLTTWPPEVMESVAEHLSLDDLRSLRLVSRALAVSVAQDTFKRYYRTKHVDVSPESLSELVGMTAAGLQGSQVQNVVLSGLAVSTENLERIVEEKARWVREGNGPIFASTQHRLSDAELVRAKADLEALQQRKAELDGFCKSGAAATLLAQAFGNLAAYGKAGGLPALTLKVDVLQDDLTTKQPPIKTRSRATVWRAGQATFRAVMAGLQRSGMPLKKLDVLTEQWHCSLGWGALEYVEQLRGTGLERALGGLQSLSLSLSADQKGSKTHGAGGSDGQLKRRREAADAALAKFLSWCPRLAQLHIHWFMLREAMYDDDAAEKLLHQAKGVSALQGISSLTLRGLRLQGSTLLSLLKAAPIKNLTLQDVRIADCEPLPPNRDMDREDSGFQDTKPALLCPPWSAIFDHCTSSETNMSSIFFDDLWGSRLLHFRGVPGGPRMPWAPPTNGSPVLDRKGANVRDPIEYTYARGRPLGSPDMYQWRSMHEREYGPA